MNVIEMNAAKLLIAAAERKGAAVDERRVEAVRKLVEDAQCEFEERATRMMVTSQDLERAYSL
jgi:hypothetical protein